MCFQVDGISGNSITHGQFRDQCRTLGSALTRLDVTKGDVVGLISPNCPEFPVTFFGVASIGAIVTTVSSAYLAGVYHPFIYVRAKIYYFTSMNNDEAR